MDAILIYEGFEFYVTGYNPDNVTGDKWICMNYDNNDLHKWHDNYFESEKFDMKVIRINI